MATSQVREVLQRLRRAVLLRDGAGLTDGQLLEDYLSRRHEAALAALRRRTSRPAPSSSRASLQSCPCCSEPASLSAPRRGRSSRTTNRGVDQLLREHGIANKSEEFFECS
jgi:hypothetical protein